ncbi:uncharacterized protein LOC121705857 [Alosa sapidissima]|uniref:uncharacterized protein LOC121705857 n=1 Tax=Alosa sapidissima TaxID=34773 RepID=UPI001C0883E7|nr:uncharacterized protein LOC121705857 [Alosa sapidissima]XP_041943080.1 uncharacterized protein LOC121705857 [Alosa sapidissima]XP_041943081.1 uncharacterized protein LOC121705857 [Alosa sapidissima]
MHWLPLVAMVIASALPFPPSPLTRLVAATTNSSQSFDNHLLDSSNSSFLEAGSSTPVQVPVDNISHGNVFQKDYNMAARKEGEASQRRAVDHVQSTLEDFSSLSYKKQREQMAKRKLNQKPLKAKHMLKSSTDLGESEQQASSNGQSIRQQDTGDYVMHGLKSQGDHSNHDDHTSLDSKPKLSQFGSQDKTDSLDAQHSGETGLLEAETARHSMQDSVALSTAHTSESRIGRPQPVLDTGGSTLEQRGAPEESQAQEVTARDTEETQRGVFTGSAPSLADGGLLDDEDLRFLDSHPRVLFSSSPVPPKHPPLLLILERDLLAGHEPGAEDRDWEDEEGVDVGGTAAGSPQDGKDVLGSAAKPPRRRSRRSAQVQHHSYEPLSMCAEESTWVTDKRTAIDLKHETVKIVPEIPTLSGPIKQYFYETSCRVDHAAQGYAHAASNTTGPSMEAGRSCIGVDKRQWNSSCQTKQSYVRALTGDDKRRRWTWIRINSSCVCVLSRVTKSRPVRVQGKR